MDELIQKISTFLNYFSDWFNQYIASGLIGFIKTLGGLFINILQFFIDILKWLIAHI